MDPKTPWSLFVQDEVGRQTETMALLPTALFPQVPVLFMGDHRQFGPVCTMLDDDTYHSFFGLQRTRSLLDRVVAAGFSNIELRENHRAVGDTGKVVRNIFYPDMLLVKAKNPLYRQVQTWLRELIPAEENFVFLDVQSSAEVPCGTSYTNPIHARGIVELVLYILRTCPSMSGKRILVVVGYSAQKQEVIYALSCVPELSREDIDVRTVDDSQSHQSDIAIFDSVRTERLGFMNREPRLAVGLSRAKYLTILLASTSVKKFDETIMYDVFIHAQCHNAFKMVEWFWCKRCQTIGHDGTNCKAPIICGRCKGNHSGRACPKAEGKPLPQGQIDNVDRPCPLTMDISRTSQKSKGSKTSNFAAVEKAGPKPPRLPKDGKKVKIRSTRAAKAGEIFTSALVKERALKAFEDQNPTSGSTPAQFDNADGGADTEDASKVLIPNTWDNSKTEDADLYGACDDENAATSNAEVADVADVAEVAEVAEVTDAADTWDASGNIEYQGVPDDGQYAPDDGW